jgi:hypothetical protein
LQKAPFFFMLATSGTDGDTPLKPAAARKTYCTVCPAWEIKRPERCSNTLKKGMKVLYFCTARCKERYQKAPEKFS